MLMACTGVVITWFWFSDVEWFVSDELPVRHPVHFITVVIICFLKVLKSACNDPSLFLLCSPNYVFFPGSKMLFSSNSRKDSTLFFLSLASFFGCSGSKCVTNNANRIQLYFSVIFFSVLFAFQLLLFQFIHKFLILPFNFPQFFLQIFILNYPLV